MPSPAPWPSTPAPSPHQRAPPSAALAALPPGALVSNGCTAATARALSPVWRSAQGPGAGLMNLGNSCFLNSVIQALTYLPPLANLCLARAHTRGCTLRDGCMCCKLEEQVARLLTRGAPAGGGVYAYGTGADAPEALHRALPLLNRCVYSACDWAYVVCALVFGQCIAVIGIV